jgi:hypothetical protein
MPFLQLTHRGAFASLQGEGTMFGTTFRAVGNGLRGLSALAVAVGLVACASITVDSTPEAKEKVVSERAEARWQLLIKGDVGGAYQYLSAGSKAATPAALYTAKIKPGMWRKAKVDKVACEGEICKVQMLITYDFERMKGIETAAPETWIIENGSAWYVYH